MKTLRLLSFATCSYVNKVIMYIFTHKAAGSHRSLLTFFWVSTFLQSGVYVHNLMFLFVKGNRVEEGYKHIYITEEMIFVL